MLTISIIFSLGFLVVLVVIGRVFTCYIAPKFKPAKPDPLEFKKGQKIIARYKGETVAARITHHVRDVPIIYAVTLRDKEYIRLSYRDIMEVKNDACRKSIENYEKGCDLFLNEEVQEIKAPGEDIKQVIKSSDKKAYVLCGILLIALIIKFIIG